MIDKVIILGPECSGKTTLAKGLKYKTNIIVLEEDEEMVKVNGGTMSMDYHHKYGILRPKIHRNIIDQNSPIIFLTSYFEPDLLSAAKRNGFHVIQLSAERGLLEQRHQERKLQEGKPDATAGFEINFPYHTSLRETGIIDKTVDARKSSAEVLEEVLAYLEQP
jgi:hypothetical protein